MHMLPMLHSAACRTAANATLSAYCAALQATCAEVNHLVMTGGVCEVRARD
jgi:hypothetical protein